MYHKAYGIIETLAPLHIGASAGEETGNLNLIFRDQFTQTGIVPGSSIRGRFRADMRSHFGKPLVNIWYGHDSDSDEVAESSRNEQNLELETSSKDRTTEALVKFEYASLLWLPVFCPGQPIVWVSCHRLLKRYQQIADIHGDIPKPASEGEGEPIKHPVSLKQKCDRLFFNLGFLDNLKDTPNLKNWVPKGTNIEPDNLVVVDDADISLIHDMALYRQTRTKLEDNVKKVESFFGFEALPEDSILIFPIAIKKALSSLEKAALAKLKQPEKWQPFDINTKQNSILYFGGLESIGCGRCRVTLAGEYFKTAV
ncbi:MAG: RAMP superfamily CRISPR-associated protein [Thermosynechococcaceae cyanobacterium]